jgi:uncharacterized membrane protein
MSLLIFFIPMMILHVLIGIIIIFGVAYLRRLAVALEKIAEKMEDSQNDKDRFS